MRNQSAVNRKNRMKRKQRHMRYDTPEPTREEIDSALQEYLSKGGKITILEPEWIEEGRSYITGLG